MPCVMLKASDLVYLCHVLGQWSVPCFRPVILNLCHVSATCVLLLECGDGAPCSGPCISGPKDCASEKEPCPKLERTNAGDGKVSWDCGATFNPYNSPIPDGMTCTAR